jgi:hypothetical protein
MHGMSSFALERYIEEFEASTTMHSVPDLVDGLPATPRAASQRWRQQQQGAEEGTLGSLSPLQPAPATSHRGVATSPALTRLQNIRAIVEDVKADPQLQPMGGLHDTRATAAALDQPRPTAESSAALATVVSHARRAHLERVMDMLPPPLTLRNRQLQRECAPDPYLGKLVEAVLELPPPFRAGGCRATAGRTVCRPDRGHRDGKGELDGGQSPAEQPQLRAANQPQPALEREAAARVTSTPTVATSAVASRSRCTPPRRKPSAHLAVRPPSLEAVAMQGPDSSAACAVTEGSVNPTAGASAHSGTPGESSVLGARLPALASGGREGAFSLDGGEGSGGEDTAALLLELEELTAEADAAYGRAEPPRGSAAAAVAAALAAGGDGSGGGGGGGAVATNQQRLRRRLCSGQQPLTLGRGQHATKTTDRGAAKFLRGVAALRIVGTVALTVGSLLLPDMAML